MNQDHTVWGRAEDGAPGAAEMRLDAGDSSLSQNENGLKRGPAGGFATPLAGRRMAVSQGEGRTTRAERIEARHDIDSEYTYRPNSMIIEHKASSTKQKVDMDEAMMKLIRELRADVNKLQQASDDNIQHTVDKIKEMD